MSNKFKNEKVEALNKIAYEIKKISLCISLLSILFGAYVGASIGHMFCH